MAKIEKKIQIPTSVGVKYKYVLNDGSSIIYDKDVFNINDNISIYQNGSSNQKEKVSATEYSIILQSSIKTVSQANFKNDDVKDFEELLEKGKAIADFIIEETKKFIENEKEE